MNRSRNSYLFFTSFLFTSVAIHAQITEVRSVVGCKKGNATLRFYLKEDNPVPIINIYDVLKRKKVCPIKAKPVLKCLKKYNKN